MSRQRNIKMWGHIPTAYIKFGFDSMHFIPQFQLDRSREIKKACRLVYVNKAKDIGLVKKL